MYRNKSVGAVILAAGRSERMGGGVNKVYRDLDGSPVLYHSINSFIASGITDELVLVYNEMDKTVLEDTVIPELQERMTVETVQGGEKRQDSSLAGLRSLGTEYALIHDGARPNFSNSLVEKLLGAAVEHGAAFPGVKPVDTIRRSKNGFAGATVNREELVRVQTPQCFKSDLVLKALEEFSRDGKYYSDDAGAVMDYWGIDPKIVEGERENLKLTTNRDMKYAELLFGS
jgi:2-C-methyl-D-erythritol 4-phosphate cytidylyltransferase